MAEKNVNSGQKKASLKQSPQIIGDIGRVPPQAVDIEEAVLGAMLLDNNAITNVIDILSADSFYKVEHRKIFEAILDLFGNSQTIDSLTVTEKLRKSGDLQLVGGPGYIAALTNRVASSAHVEYHARILSEKEFCVL